jgi:benzoylformate decarboxylase
MLAGLLHDATNPVLVLGASVDDQRSWAASVALAEATGAAVMMAPMTSRWSFPGWHPQFRGVLMPAVAAASAQLAPFDLALVVGAPVFRYYPNVPGELLPTGTRLAQITDDPDEAARSPMGDAFVADPGAVLEALAERVGREGTPARRTVGEAPVPAAAPHSVPLSPLDVYEVLGRVFPHDLAMVHESPSNFNSMFSVWRPQQPRSLFFSGSGGLGFGASATVGVQMGMPDRRVVGVLGDGALHYSVQGLYTAALHDVPATFLVMRNSQYAVLKWFGRLENAADVPGLDLPGLDAVAIADGYGVPGETVADAETLEAALTRAAEGSGPRLIQVDIDDSAEAM